MPLFSIIIPVYNRENTLRRCIDSVFDQDFSDWELIIINDGSTDESEKVIKEYISNGRTNRIIYEYQENRGAASARNRGLELAAGKYICFLDSDDWYEASLLQKCADVIEEYSPDCINFFVRTISKDSRSVTKRSLIFDSSERERDIATRRDTFVCSKVCKRELFSKFSLRFAGRRTLEDFEINVLESFFSDSLIQIPFALYNYEKGSENSLCDQKDAKIECLPDIPYSLKKIACKYGRYDEKDVYNLARAYLLEIKFCLQGNDHKLADQIKAIYTGVAKNIYPKIYRVVTGRYMVLGGYTLRSATQSIMLDCSEIVHYQFLSLCQLMNVETPISINALYGNSFRKRMLERELNNDPIKEVSNGLYDYLIMDFIEERFDLWNSDEYWITNSDAFEESNTKLDEKWRLVSRNTDEVSKEFRKNWDKFIELAKDLGFLRKIILVENYLNEKYGEFGGETLFDNAKDIREINGILRTYYEYAAQSGVIILHPHERGECFSDTDYKHGCKPSHTVEGWEAMIGDMIFEAIFEQYA